MLGLRSKVTGVTAVGAGCNKQLGTSLPLLTTGRSAIVKAPTEPRDLPVSS